MIAVSGHRYALIVGNQVFWLFSAADMPAWNDGEITVADITGVAPAPQMGWSATENAGTWSFAAPAPAPSLTLAQQAGVALTEGLTIELAGSDVLAFTLFPTDSTTQMKLGAVVTTLNATGAFPGGATSYPMKDSAGAWHTFTVSQYKAVAGAIAAYVAALDLIADGNPLSAAGLPVAAVSLTV